MYIVKLDLKCSLLWGFENRAMLVLGGKWALVIQWCVGVLGTKAGQACRKWIITSQLNLGIYEILNWKLLKIPVTPWCCIKADWLPPRACQRQGWGWSASFLRTHTHTLKFIQAYTWKSLLSFFQCMFLSFALKIN